MIDVTGSYGAIAETVEVGDGYAVLFMQDGLIRFAHDCARRRQGRVLETIRCAPHLTNVGQPGGHQLVTREPLHIEPSILCGDCGTHGFVRSGSWVAA